MIRTRPRAVLLDWDNTLVDSWAIIHDAMNHTLAAFGRPLWTLDDIRHRVRRSMRESFPVLFGEAWEEAGKVFYARFEEIHVARLAPLPGAGDLIEALAGAGIRLGVVSNKKGAFLRREADHLGWSRHFDHLVGAGDASADKPDGAPVAMALAGSGIAAGPEVWFVGDADIDLECAHRAGCVAVLVRAEVPAPNEFSAFPPAVHVPDCVALSKLVLNL